MNAAEARQLLAVQATASPSEVKSAYRRMAKRWHPDRFASDSALYSEAICRTQRINAAYGLLERDDRSQELQQSDAQAPSAPAWKSSKWWPFRPLMSAEDVIFFSVMLAVVVVISWAISLLLG